MKTIKIIFDFLFKLLMIGLFCGFLYSAAITHVSTPFAALICITMFVIMVMPRRSVGDVNVIQSGPLVELWTGELIEKFRFIGRWLSVIPREDKYVNNNVIHLVDVGADPSVLIDNSSYPIAVSSRSDSDIPVALKKFDTTNTKVTKDELYALPYDKGASVLKQHRDTLEETTSQYGLYNLAPASNSTNTPLVATTGADNGNSRKRMTIADIATAKLKLDTLKVPLAGRVLVLCSDHLNDLLNLDQSFRDRFYNTKTGEPMDFMGFQIFQDVYNPIYNDSGAKKAWGASAAPSTDRNASVFFYAPRAFQAMGAVTMFYRDAETDPENRQTVMGFQLYHIVLPKKNIGFGAIVSTIVS